MCKNIFLTYFNHHGKIWFIIGHEEFRDVFNRKILLWGLHQNLYNGGKWMMIQITSTKRKYWKLLLILLTSYSDQNPFCGTSQARLGSVLCSPTRSSALTTQDSILSPTWSTDYFLGFILLEAKQCFRHKIIAHLRLPQTPSGPSPGLPRHPPGSPGIFGNILIKVWSLAEIYPTDFGLEISVRWFFHPLPLSSTSTSLCHAFPSLQCTVIYQHHFFFHFHCHSHFHSQFYLHFHQNRLPDMLLLPLWALLLKKVVQHDAAHAVTHLWKTDNFNFH